MNRLARLGAALTLVVLLPAFAGEPGDPIEEALRAGKTAQEKGALDEAEREYRKALQLAEHLQNPELVFRSLFFLGLTKQKAGDDAADEQRVQARAEARDFYERALDLKPGSTSTLLNLAEVVRAMGDRDAAEALLRRGLEIKDERYAQFAERLGDIAVDRWTEDPLPTYNQAALRNYRLALDEKSTSTSLRDKYATQVLLAWTAEDGDGTDAKYARELRGDLWKSIASGDVDHAIAGALRALTVRARSFDGEVEMLTIVTAGLAKKAYDVVGFAKSDAFGPLKALTVSQGFDAAFRNRVESLLALYQGDVVRPEQLAAWKEPADAHRSVDRPTGIENIRQIARALGYTAQRDKAYPKAEQMYELALRLDETALDPATLRDLATVYYAQDKLLQLDPRLRAFEQALYDAKSLAYHRVDWQQVYEYHRALGSMYLWLKQFDGAKTQLDQAVNAALHIRPSATKRRPLEIDPDLRMERGKVYSALGVGTTGSLEFLEAAEGYIRAGDLIRARAAVSQLDPHNLPREKDTKRIAAVLDATVIFDRPPAVENVLDVKQAIAVLSTNPERPRRIATERQLDQWGITNVRLDQHAGTFRYAKRVVAFRMPDEAKAFRPSF